MLSTMTYEVTPVQSKMEKQAVLILRAILINLENRTTEFDSKALKDLVFVLFSFCFNCVYNSWRYVMYSYQAVNIRCE